jgi:electron transfer flavoprotein beta subunit
MDIVVCMKEVPDPECPRGGLTINPGELRVDLRGVPPVLSPFDENALEAALRIKDEHPPRGVKITVVSVGKKISKAVLETALAAGADELVKVEDDAFASNALDSFACASILACAIRNMGGFDLILAGRQAADWNAGQVGVGVAHLLGLPVVTLARKVEMHGGCAIVERLTSAGYETLRAPLPAVVVVSNEVGMMRYPSIIQRREAKKKPVVSWGAGDIGLGLPLEKRLLLRKLFAPAMRQRDCVFVEAESAAEAGRKLAQRLSSDGII